MTLREVSEQAHDLTARARDLRRTTDAFEVDRAKAELGGETATDAGGEPGAEGGDGGDAGDGTDAESDPEGEPEPEPDDTAFTFGAEEADETGSSVSADGGVTPAAAEGAAAGDAGEADETNETSGTDETSGIDETDETDAPLDGSSRERAEE